MDISAPLENAIRVIDHWLAYKIAMGRIPGLSAGIVHKQQVVFSQGYGYANVEQQKATTASTGYRIASFSKVFTATAILQLFEQGKLQLDAPASDYLPWMRREQDKRVQQITLRQLLTHTSGLDRDGETPHWVDFHFPTLELLQQHLAADALVYTPATTWKYSNFGYSLLGAVVHAVAGIPYEEYIAEHILKPLKLAQTGPEVTESLLPALATGYGREYPGQSRQPFPLIHTAAMASATGFASSALDLCTFMQAHLTGNLTLLTDETKREMRRVQWLREGTDADWCLGFQTWKVNERRIYGHGGSFQGYQSRFGIDPERELGLVILTNAIDGPASILADGAFKIIDHLVTHFEDFTRSENRIADARKYEGYFRSVWGDVTIEAIGEGLILYPSDSLAPSLDFYQMKCEDDGAFRLISGNSIGNLGERVRFEWNEDGGVQRVIVGPNPSERLDSLDIIPGA